MNQVRVPAQVVPGFVTTADGHLRYAHLLLEKAGDPFMAEGVKAQFRKPQGLGALGKFAGDRLRLERKNQVFAFNPWLHGNDLLADRAQRHFLVIAVFLLAVFLTLWASTIQKLICSLRPCLSQRRHVV